jgi:two-component system CheB/CheR fusion protein
VASTAAIEFGFGAQAGDHPPAIQPGAGQRSSANLAGLAERKILELYGPPGVVINEDLDVVHVRGRTGPYLEPMPGAPSFNILRLARPDLHVELRRTIQEAKVSGARAQVECRLAVDGKTRTVEIEVVPVTEPETKTRCFLILFREPVAASPSPAGEPAAPGPPGEEQRYQELERELTVAKEYLQSTIEELESANEELKSSNEELQSSNEELQSTNEELETSKEELQSSNEELTTVNDELQNRMGELQQINDDLHNILGVIGEAVIIVDLHGRIRRFNQLAERLFNLVSADIGRSVSMLNTFIVGPRVEELAARVVDRPAPIESSVQTTDRNRYTVRVTPYRTLDQSIKGGVIAFVPEKPLGRKTPARGGAAAAPKRHRQPARAPSGERNGRRKLRGRP